MALITTDILPKLSKQCLTKTLAIIYVPELGHPAEQAKKADKFSHAKILSLRSNFSNFHIAFASFLTSLLPSWLCSLLGEIEIKLTLLCEVTINSICKCFVFFFLHAFAYKI